MSGRNGMTDDAKLREEEMEKVYQEFMMPILIDFQQLIVRQTEENEVVLPAESIKELTFEFTQRLILEWEKHSEGKAPKYFK